MIRPPHMNELAAGDSRPRALIEAVLGKATVATISLGVQAAERERAAHDEDLRRVLAGIIARLGGEATR